MNDPAFTEHTDLPPLQQEAAFVETASTGAVTRSSRQAPLWLAGLLITTVLVSAAVVYWLIVRPNVLTTAPLTASTLNDAIEPVAPPPEETIETAPVLSTSEFLVESATGANDSLPDLVAAGPAEPTPDIGSPQPPATTAAVEPAWSDALQSHADAASAELEAMEQRILKLEQQIADMAGEHERLKERLRQGLEQPVKRVERTVTRPQPPSPTVRSIRILNGSAQARLVFDANPLQPVLMEEGQEYQGWTLTAVNWPAGSVTVAHAASGTTQVLL